MSDDLGKRLGSAAGGGTSPGPQAAWDEAQRRIRRGRTVTGALVVLALVGVAALVAAALANRSDETERVGSGPVVASTTTSLADVRCDPEPSMEDRPTPATAAEFVGEGSGQVGGRSDVVTRATVTRSWWLDPVADGPGEQLWTHRTELEVTDPVRGAEVGEKLVVFDAIGHGTGSEPVGITGPPCHQFEVGDDVIVALAAPPASAPDEPYELNGGSSFFVITDGRFSPELDAARRSLGIRQPAFGTSELLQQARDLTPDQFLDVLRDAAQADPPVGDEATWMIDPDDPPSPGASTFTALVSRLGCSGGRTGEVYDPVIEQDDTGVTVTFSVAPLPTNQAYTCPGNDSVPVTVDLGEPLGDRPLRDGFCTAGGGTAFCVDGPIRWPR